MDRHPPDPPDPPDDHSTQDSMELSPPLFTQPGTKRRLDPEIQTVPTKKSVTDTPQSLPAEQTLYKHPSLEDDSQKTYSNLDKGPFIVHVSLHEHSPSSGTSIRPIIFGRFLSKNQIKDIANDGIKKVGRNRISVEFKNSTAANNFLNNSLLKSNKYVAAIPTFNVTRMGIVRNIPTDLSMSEFVESLIIPEGCGLVLKARRLNRKQTQNSEVTWVPTQSVVLTFKGQVLPKRVFSYYTSIPVESYLFPTIQCNNCCRFGHIKAQCRSKPRCYRCAQPHAGADCLITEDKSTCLYCSGRHFATNKVCPEQCRQRAIKITMSQDNISYQEASQLHPQSRLSYADSTRAPAVPQLPRSSLTQSPPSPNSPISYRKTVTRSPNTRPPLGKSYDRIAHQNIVRNVPSSLPNGCALGNDIQTHDDTPNDDTLDLLWLLVANILSKFSDIPPPPNVASKIMPLLSSLSKNGSEHLTMEL